MASMARMNLSSPAALKDGLSTRVAAAKPSSATFRGAQQQQQQGPSVPVTAGTTRRSLLSLVATGLASGSFVPVVLADAVPIKVGPPPPPSGGLPGTLNSDEARDLNLPLKKRFFLQPLSPSEAAERFKESAKEIVNVKSFIDKKAWPYVQNDLRLKSEYLRYDLNTIVSSQPREVKKSFKEITGKLFEDINNLDYAAKIKSTPKAEKYYEETVSALNDVLAKVDQCVTKQ